MAVKELYPIKIMSFSPPVFYSTELEKTGNFRPYKLKKLVSHGRQETSTNGLAPPLFGIRASVYY